DAGRKPALPIFKMQAGSLRSQYSRCRLEACAPNIQDAGRKPALPIFKMQAGSLRSQYSRCRLDACAPEDYWPGVRTTISFVALSTAVLLNGSARGVTLRQSSN